VIRTSFRLPLTTIQRLDTIAAALRKKQVGKVTRADVLRMLIAGGLSRVDKEKRRAKAKK
jgi:predicted DNA-binding protein